MKRRAALFAVALLAAACGDIDGDFDDTSTTGDGDTTSTGDGDGDGDGGGCRMQLSWSPMNPELGDTVVLDAEIADVPDVGAFFDWRITYDNEPVEFLPRDEDSRAVQFGAERTGVYSVSLEGGADGLDCRSASDGVNVTEPGAERRSYELRITAPAGTALDERRIVRVPVGSSFELGAISLDPPVVVDGTVVGPDGPVAAYLRAEPTSGGPAVEAFAGADGAFSLGLGVAAQDVLVVPAGNLAPALLREQFPADLDGDLALDAGVVVAGAVRDAAGAPVVGARVSLASVGVPSTVATSAADGAVTVRARLAGATSLLVAEAVPDGSSALVRLQVSAAAGWVPSGGPFAMDYQAGFVRRPHAFRVELPEGAPAGGARVVLQSRPIAGAASLADGGFVAEAEAVVRFDGRADPAGVVGPVSLPDGVYDVVALPPAGAAAAAYVAVLDLSGGAPAPEALRLAAGFTLSGAVSGTGRPVVFSARPADSLAGPALEARSVSAGGAYQLVLAPGVDYVVTASAPPSADRAPARFAVTAGADGGQETRDVTLGPASELRGTVTLPGSGGVAGAHVGLFCVIDCTGREDGLVSEAVTDAGGDFALVVPD